MIALPDTAYVPGKTPRPEEGAYDALKDVSGPLEDCAAWRAGWRFFEAGCYWEAHEVWEAVWMAAPEQSAEKTMVQGVIQRANALLKHRMGRPKAADRLNGMADDLMKDAWTRAGGPVMGIAPGDMQYNAQNGRKVPNLEL